MIRIFYALIAGLVIASPLALAGNAEMMEQRARQLIELSDDVVRQLQQGKIREGQITFKARVIYPPNGERTIILDRADIDESGDESGDENLENADTGAQSAEPINSASGSGSGSGIRGGGVALDTVDLPVGNAGVDWQTLRRIIDSQPDRRVSIIKFDGASDKRLQGTALEALSRRLSQGGGAYLIYW